MRHMKIGELRAELRRFDSDLLVRFRDGDALYPGICVMREDGTDHVDIGLPHPVRGRLAEIARTVRKIDACPSRAANKHEMRFEVGGERLDLEWHEDEGMFHVTLGPRRGRRFTLGSHAERAVAILMFNWEVKAMQHKWVEET